MRGWGGGGGGRLMRVSGEITLLCSRCFLSELPQQLYICKILLNVTESASLSVSVQINVRMALRMGEPLAAALGLTTTSFKSSLILSLDFMKRFSFQAHERESVI